ncbi:MAG TPA: ATP-binding protein [Caldisericia bacterium]|nr:ATP-binding protein [Caldisericia bacterium]
MIKRRLLPELIKHLKEKEISLIVGPRQAGKTTLMKLLMHELAKQNQPSLMLNLDIEEDKKYFDSQEHLLRKIRLELGNQGYVFVDEIQRKENAGLFLKGLYDMDLPYHWMVSGSGSLELKEKIHESLAGRKRVFELSTLSWEEWVEYRTSYRFEQNLGEFMELEATKTKALLEEYLSFGGFPRIVLEQELSEKRKIMSELYESYLLKDLVELLGIQKTEEFTGLARLMASQLGKMVNKQELSSTLGLHIHTINHYLWYMEKTFYIEKVTPFYRNIRKEICKAPVYYFSDLGMRNFALGLFGSSAPLLSDGFLFQNFVFHRLKDWVRDTSWQIHYWRTTNKAEVDFVVDQGIEITPVEVKYQNLLKPNPGRSLLSFLAQYQPKKAYIVHLGKEMRRMEGNTELVFLPFYRLIPASME